MTFKHECLGIATVSTALVNLLIWRKETARLADELDKRLSVYHSKMVFGDLSVTRFYV